MGEGLTGCHFKEAMEIHVAAEICWSHMQDSGNVSSNCATPDRST
jgi:hypothetical protein